jgi:hypothetical protein
MTGRPIERHGHRERHHDHGGRGEHQDSGAEWHHLLIASLTLMKAAKVLSSCEREHVPMRGAILYEVTMNPDHGLGV